jgi:hypothetical protein
MIRCEAIKLLNEIITTEPELLQSANLIDLYSPKGVTHLIIQIKPDSIDKKCLEKIITNNGYKIMDRQTMEKIVVDMAYNINFASLVDCFVIY